MCPEAHVDGIMPESVCSRFGKRIQYEAATLTEISATYLTRGQFLRVSFCQRHAYSMLGIAPQTLTGKARSGERNERIEQTPQELNR